MSTPSTAATTNASQQQQQKVVIDWDEAMEQCGDDEEFLRELLGDLRAETDAQMIKIKEVLQNVSNNEPDKLHTIMRASHVIKGAASNLMCGELRVAAMQLEQASSNGGGMATTNNSTEHSLQQPYDNLKRAVENYHAFLQSIGI